MRSVCIVGGGWAGLAAAVEAVRLGWRVTLLEMAAELGGRARRVGAGPGLDNGQHILIGAYRATLHLMQHVGVTLDEVLQRRPLELVFPDGTGLRLPPGAPAVAFARGLIDADGWSWRDRLGLAKAAATWTLRRFRCPPSMTVAELVAGIPQRIREDVIEPLCVAALNTPASEASATVFLRVMQDGLFGGPGSADLLLPRTDLSKLLPLPASAWLHRHGADIRLARRVATIGRESTRWRVDEESFDAVVLACTAVEAARLARPVQPTWADAAAAFQYEPIVTAYVRSGGSQLPRPMMALRSDGTRPAQFVFDHGSLGGAPGWFAAVSSGAAHWAAVGAEATAEAVRRQLVEAFPAGTWAEPPRVDRVLTDRRATFRCVPGLQRPGRIVAAGLHAAGDYVDGPYPATLESAVRSGIEAVREFGMQT